MTTTILNEKGIFLKTMHSEKPVKAQDLELIMASFDGTQQKEIIMQADPMFDNS